MDGSVQRLRHARFRNLARSLALAGVGVTLVSELALAQSAGGGTQRTPPPTQEQLLHDCQHSDFSAIVIRSCSTLLNSGVGDAVPKAQILTWRGSAWVKDRDAEAAISDFTYALELDANNLVATRGRAGAHEMRGDHLAAVKDWTALIALNTGNAESYRDRAYAFSATDNHPAAIADFTKAIELDDSNADAYVGRALAYDKLNKLADALADFEMALARNPNFIRAFVARGDMWERRGEREKAISDLQRALQINSFNLVVRKSLQRLGIYHPYP